MFGLLQLAMGLEPLRVKIDGHDLASGAYVTGHGVRQLFIEGVPAIGFVVYPQHPVYRAIHYLAIPRVREVSRAVFNPYDEQLKEAFEGTLDMLSAQKLFDEIITTLSSLLPSPPMLDPRLENVIQLMQMDHSRTIESLGPSTGLSTNYLSTLFTKEMGIDLRLFRLSLKLSKGMRFYAPTMTLTEIAQRAGFSDSQHLSNAFKEVYGAPPSYFIDNSDIHR
jgi:AraC-like DNA-binding protein